MNAHVEHRAHTVASRPATHTPPRGVALQPIWDTNGVLLGHEYLYRTRSGRPAGVDRWAVARQDAASASVLGTVFGHHGRIPASELVFVNVTRSFLVRSRPLPAHHERLVLEVVETVPADAGVLLGLRRLRAHGYRIAVDDYVASRDQLAMLPYADYVKVDCRDLAHLSASALDHARRFGARLVAERVSDPGARAAAIAHGFEFLQGDLLGAASPWHG